MNKRKYIFVFLLLLSFLLVACDKKNEEVKESKELEGVKMVIKEGTLTNVGATITILDISDENRTYGDWFRIEQEDGDTWKEVKKVSKEEYKYGDKEYKVNSESRVEINVNWEKLYGTLEAGNYRLVKSVTEDGKEFYFNVEFNLTEKVEENKEEPKAEEKTEEKTEEKVEEKPVVPAVITVTGIKISKTSVNLEVGSTTRVTATISPSNATNKKVTWSSSNVGVATVSSNGTITAKSAGTAIITVKTADGGFTRTVNVTVTEPAPAMTKATAYASVKDTLLKSSFYCNGDICYRDAANGVKHKVDLANNYYSYVYSEGGEYRAAYCTNKGYYIQGSSTYLEHDFTTNRYTCEFDNTSLCNRMLTVIQAAYNLSHSLMSDEEMRYMCS